MSDLTRDPQIDELRSVFGDYKAEWLRERVYSLFSEPNYYTDLQTDKPCVLEGGRGTGKTTALKGLSYEGRYKIHNRNPTAILDGQFIGLYYRVDTNKVASFKGPELTEQEWIRHFAHYLNLQICGLMIEFVQWSHGTLGTEIYLDVNDLNAVADSLHLRRCGSSEEFAANLRESVNIFQAHINNVADGGGPKLSMSGVPTELLSKAILHSSPFQDKLFIILIDEYENFADYQQKVVNSLIKHAPSTYTFKVGVRELGWRIRETLHGERLVSPADYKYLRIENHLQDSFKTFAQDVCNARLRQFEENGAKIPSIEDALQSLTADEEAELLGIGEQVKEIANIIRPTLSQNDQNFFDTLSQLEVYFLRFRAGINPVALKAELRGALKDKTTWRTNFGNYKHALLFTIKRGKSGIRKYYCGWETVLHLSSFNIRFLLQIVDHCYALHLRSNKPISEPIDAKTQTESCQEVARINLTELEGLTVEGANLTKFLLSLGRVFQVMAREATGHTPEVNQFHLKRESEINTDTSRRVNDLIRAAIMHLALVRWSGSKLSDRGDTREYDYMIHPIFCPLFDYSYRRKRKLPLTDVEILGLLSTPKRSIQLLLERVGRNVQEAPVPQQLGLFENYYDFDS